MTNPPSCDFDRDALVAAALEAHARAYAPYSHFPVGAALRTAAGEVHVGCNIENASFGLTNCAERVAVGAAVVAGDREFTAIAIASAGGVSPCGACRQVLAEFAPRLQVLMVDTETGVIREATIAELLPLRFDAGDIPS